MRKLSISFKEKNIEFILEYKKRKTLSIEIDRIGKVKVKAPIGLQEKVITDFIIKKEKWIIEKLNEISTLNNKIIERKYLNGELFLYLGKEYKLKIIIHNQFKKNRVELIGNELIVLCKKEGEEIIKNTLKKWYREKALENIKYRISLYNKFFYKEPRSIKVREQKRRYGSCSYKDDLIFNWRLIMAPQEIIDYVVVHEMCHINHKNHSKSYWNNVRSIMEDYKDRELWLKNYGYKLYE